MAKSIKKGDILWGWHAVCSAVHNPKRRIQRIISCHARPDHIPDDIPYRMVSPKELGTIIPSNVVHQGIIAFADPLPGLSLDDLCPKKGNLLVIDHITDPHNVGALWRSAAAFQTQAIIMTVDKSPPLSGTLAKSACGALEYTPYIFVKNTARTLDILKKKGFFVVGLSEKGTQALELTCIDPVALVVGSEEKGIRPLVQKKCDILSKITTSHTFQTLNASVAGALALSHFFNIKHRNHDDQ